MRGHPIFAAAYDLMTRGVERGGLAEMRAELLREARGRTLELGAGTGHNLAHYPDSVDELRPHGARPHAQDRPDSAPHGPGRRAPSRLGLIATPWGGVKKLEPLRLRPWMLPAIVAAIVVPITAAFMFGGPGVGLAVGALAAAVILITAAVAVFEEPIEVAPGTAGRFALLVVLTATLDDPVAVGEVAEIAAAGASAAGASETEILLLRRPSTAPSPTGCPTWMPPASMLSVGSPSPWARSPRQSSPDGGRSATPTSSRRSRTACARSEPRR